MRGGEGKILLNIKITDVKLTPQTVTVSGTFQISVTAEDILFPVEEAAGDMLQDAAGTAIEYVPH